MVFIVKQCAALLLLLALLLQTFSKGMIVVDFYANRDYIAKNLCLNRDKPQLHCNGRCQLCKRLKQEDNQDKSTPERKDNAKNQLLLSREDYAVLIPGPPGDPRHHFPAHSTDPITDRPSFCFHPPD